MEGYRCEACREQAQRCEPCRARKAAKRRALRARRRKASLCSECGCEALEGQSRCADCRISNNALSGAAHAARREEA